MSALDVFECARGLIQVTERADLKGERRGVEKPFFQGDYLVFPEVSRGRLVGFYVYKETRAWHYDAVEKLDTKSDTPGRLRAGATRKRFTLDSAPLEGDRIYQMVTQPDGLRTLTLLYMPGLWTKESTAQAPVALGSTVLPVVGAWMAHSRFVNTDVYHNPSDAREEDIQSWIYQKLERKPATVKDVPVRRSMIRLTSENKKDDNALWHPLKREMQLRKNWIRTHNLDVPTFQKFSQLIEGVCREGSGASH